MGLRDKRHVAVTLAVSGETKREEKS